MSLIRHTKRDSQNVISESLHFQGYYRISQYTKGLNIMN